MKNASSAVCARGWEIYRDARDEGTILTLQQINARLIIEGMMNGSPPIKPRSTSHWSRMYKAGQRDYMTQNRFDLRHDDGGPYAGQ